ncbi:MAG: ABC transporter substrate-binding protein [Candidatus Adiutrix sp.]|jgi:NitT/TauT family transport system substrate-binding protein|nr:ABC transporter substrate-binding protein [Candidatus Adiutrix sp.]
MAKPVAKTLLQIIKVPTPGGTTDTAKLAAAAFALVAAILIFADAGAYAAEEKIKLKVAAQATSGQVFQYMAEDKGYLDDEGIEVEMVYINNGTDATSALSSGKVDVISTYSTGGPLIQIANGQKFSIFGGYMIIGATPVFARPETEYAGLESLVGKKIAIMRGGTPDIVLKGILFDAGYDVYKDVTFVEMKRNQDVLEAVRSGQADFGSVSTGFEVQINQSGMKVVMWPDELWPNHSCCRMLAKTDWMNNNPEALKKLLRAYIRAEKDMRSNMPRVVELVMAKLDMTREIAESFLLSPHILYEADPYKNSVVKMWEKMRGFGYLVDPAMDINDHINTAIYKSALDSLLAEYPDEPFYKDKLALFNEHNM